MSEGKRTVVQKQVPNTTITDVKKSDRPSAAPESKLGSNSTGTTKPVNGANVTNVIPTKTATSVKTPARTPAASNAQGLVNTSRATEVKTPVRKAAVIETPFSKPVAAANKPSVAAAVTKSSNDPVQSRASRDYWVGGFIMPGTVEPFNYNPQIPQTSVKLSAKTKPTEKKQSSSSGIYAAPVLKPPLARPNTEKALPPIPIQQKTQRRKKAVIIGINYTGGGQGTPLSGCVNDAKRCFDMLIDIYGYKSKNMMLLTDDPKDDPRCRPTHYNIIWSMKWLVEDAAPGDSLFFHYSGHGNQVNDMDGDELDGKDEIIFPSDYRQGTDKYITDDTMNEIMVQPLPKGCRLTALFDACHSGSALDLRLKYSSNGKPSLAVSKSDTRTTLGQVIMYGACKDSETSAESQRAWEVSGAMSSAFMSYLERKPHPTYQELLMSIRDTMLRNRYCQKPQLSSAHEFQIATEKFDI